MACEPWRTPSWPRWRHEAGQLVGVIPEYSVRAVYGEQRYYPLLQMMANRMAVSEHKYGKIETVYPHDKQAVNNIAVRVALYHETGNTEWLLDAANYCLIEMLAPSHPDAHFRATDSDESPGIK